MKQSQNITEDNTTAGERAPNKDQFLSMVLLINFFSTSSLPVFNCTLDDKHCASQPCRNVTGK